MAGVFSHVNNTCTIFSIKHTLFESTLLCVDFLDVSMGDIQVPVSTLV